MKKSIFLFLFFIIACAVFAQENNLPVFMVEFNTGYAAGINLDNAIHLDAKITYPFQKFGFVLEAGSLFTPDKPSFHFFLGPMYFFINDKNWRVPLAIGFDLVNGETLYLGLGSIISVHRRLTKHIYTGLNLRITYAFNNEYEEVTGYKDAAIGVDKNGDKIYPIGSDGTPVLLSPIRERKSHWGSYVYVKPSILIGLQF